MYVSIFWVSMPSGLKRLLVVIAESVSQQIIRISTRKCKLPCLLSRSGSEIALLLYSAMRWFISMSISYLGSRKCICTILIVWIFPARRMNLVTLRRRTVAAEVVPKACQGESLWRQVTYSFALLHWKKRKR